jgi:uncharacterized protein
MIKKLMASKKQAMIDKNEIMKSMLSVLHGKAQSIAKEDGNREMTDNDVISASQYLIKQNQKARELIASKPDAVAVADIELKILNDFLPTQMTEDETIAFVDSIIEQLAPEDRNRKNQGKIMAQLKEKATVINMGFASKYVSTKLS